MASNASAVLIGRKKSREYLLQLSMAHTAPHLLQLMTWQWKCTSCYRTKSICWITQKAIILTEKNHPLATSSCNPSSDSRGGGIAAIMMSVHKETERPEWEMPAELVLYFQPSALHSASADCDNITTCSAQFIHYNRTPAPKSNCRTTVN